SVTTIVAQNRGAKKYDRVPKGFHSGLIIGIFYTLFVAAVVYCFPEILMGLFLNSGDTNIIQMGAGYLRSMAAFYLATAFTQTMQGLFRGLGRLDVTLLGSLIQIGIRVLITYLMIYTLGINAVAIGTGIGWLCMIVYETIVWVRYKRYELSAQENSEKDEKEVEEKFKA
ncbi:MAG: MATE family efflux transporter, partial [Oscillospiraceae bacterium]|nr:MATE family efflux transporter [Oscillospiraceae bacterium]